MRLAIEQLDEVYQTAEAVSEIEAQAQEALTEMRSTLQGFEWKPEEHLTDR